MNNPKAFQHDGFETTSDGQEFHTTYQGMTLLDYFAGQALAGMLGQSHTETMGNLLTNSSPEDVADLAYDHAEAMLAERKRR